MIRARLVSGIAAFALVVPLTATASLARLEVWVDPESGAIEPFPSTQLMSRPRLRPTVAEEP